MKLLPASVFPARHRLPERAQTCKMSFNERSPAVWPLVSLIPPTAPSPPVAGAHVIITVKINKGTENEESIESIG